MAESNSDDNKGGDDTDLTPEDELRSAKYPDGDVETPATGEDEPLDGEGDDDESDDGADDDDKIDDDDASDDDSEEDEKPDSDEEKPYVKEFPNIKGDNLPDYTRNLEQAYRNSSTEATRLKRENDELKAKNTAIGDDDGSDAGTDDKPLDPLQLWAKQNFDDAATKAYEEFSEKYPSKLADAAEFDKLTKTVATISTVIQKNEKRLAQPSELYSKAAVMLGWTPEDTPSDEDRLKVALKNGAAIPRTSSSPKKVPKSKVDDNQVAIYRKMNPSDTKTDAEIRKELEAFV